MVRIAYIFILFLCCCTVTIAEEVTWDQLEAGFSFKVKGLHDSLISFKVNGSSYEAQANFVLRKTYDSGHFFKRDEWSIALVNPKGNSIKFSDAAIEIIFAGDRVFPTNQKRSKFSFTVESICPSISEIIFDKIRGDLRSSARSSKISGGDITLGKLYSELRKDNLKHYVDSLPDADTHFSQCIDVFHLMRLMKNEKRHGFGTGSYELPDSIRHYIANIASVLNDYARTYTLSDAMISVIGYTDARGVDVPIEINPGLSVRYNADKCPKDKALGISYVSLSSRDFTKIHEIHNNCQLSAARAKAALDHLRSGIYTANVAYRYAAGGIKDNRKEDIPENRSIMIRIKIDAGK